jgi:hypothetical protein
MDASEDSSSNFKFVHSNTWARAFRNSQGSPTKYLRPAARETTHVSRIFSDKIHVNTAIKMESHKSFAFQTLLKVVLSVCMYLVSFDKTAIAQHSHQRNVLPGGRASLLGGAYTALSDDPSGAWYNPAGISHAKKNEISLSGNAWRTATTTYKEAVNGEHFIEESSSIYPSFIGSTVRWKSLTFGWSYVTLDARNVNQDHRFTNISEAANAANTYTRTNQESSAWQNAGGSIALALSKNFSLGASVYWYRRTIESSTHQMSQLNGGGLQVLDFKYQTTNEGISPVVGIVVRGDFMSAGVSLRAPQALSDHTTYSSDTVTWIPNEDTAPNVSSTEGKLRILDEPNPQTLQLGWAWFPSKNFLVSIDILQHGAVDYGDATPDLHSTTNWSLGTEITFDPLLFRIGAFSNNSMYRQPTSTKTDQPAWVDFIGFSGGIGFQEKERESMLGVVHQQGQGKAQIITGSATIQDVEASSTTWLLSSRLFF